MFMSNSPPFQYESGGGGLADERGGLSGVAAKFYKAVRHAGAHYSKPKER
jgi:hypothetical protein